METILDILSWVLVLTGAFFMIAGSLGLLRMPDFFSRQHAAGITDTMGADLILIALMLQLPLGLGTAKLFFIMVFLFLTSPTASHALAQAAFSTGMRPLGTDLREKKVPNGRGSIKLSTPVEDEREGVPSNR